MYIVFISTMLFVMNTQSYVPEEPGVEVLNLVDVPFNNTTDKYEIEVNNIINITILVKNLTNETYTNVSIIQEIPIAGVEFYEHPYERFTGENASYTDIEIPDVLNHNSLQLNYLNVTQSNFTLNMDFMQNDSSFAIKYSVNMTSDGDFSFPRTNVTYYDHWGDLNYMESVNYLLITVIKPTNDTRTYYRVNPGDVEDFELMKILPWSLGVLVIAVFSRSLYLKKPFD